MTAYFVASVFAVTDPDKLKEYGANVPPVTQKYGGKVIATGKEGGRVPVRSHAQDRHARGHEDVVEAAEQLERLVADMGAQAASGFAERREPHRLPLVDQPGPDGSAQVGGV